MFGPDSVSYSYYIKDNKYAISSDAKIATP
jgi:hypothetical protein